MQVVGTQLELVPACVVGHKVDTYSKEARMRTSLSAFSFSLTLNFPIFTCLKTIQLSPFCQTMERLEIRKTYLFEGINHTVTVSLHLVHFRVSAVTWNTNKC
jgi:hypothetical protein